MQKNPTIATTIDGTPVSFPAGTLLLQAAKSLGREIPTLCHSDRLQPCGSCRICLVEEVGAGYVPACATEIREGARYVTTSVALDQIRRGILGMILRRHPLHCRGCRVDGRCQLQRVAIQLGFSPDGQAGGSLSEIDTRHPMIHRHHDLCIQCGVCVRACHEIQGQDVLGMAGRGEGMRVVAGGDLSLEEAGCVSCGQCLYECPTGALQAGDQTRPGSFDREVTTTCGYCAVGCRLRVQVKENRIVGMEPDLDGSANRGHACVKGRFGFQFVEAPDRLRLPLIRQPDGTFRESGWEEALDLVARRFMDIRQREGGRALGVVSSARCTNEENYLLQKMARVVFGTNNIDNCARVCHSPSAFALGEALGTGAGTNSFEDVERSDVLLLVGANPTEAHPVFGARIKQAVRQGCRLIVIDPRNTELARLADIHIPLRPGSNVPVINAMQSVLIEEELFDEAFIRKHAEGFEAIQDGLQGCTPEWAGEHAGVDGALITQAARLYASGKASQILWGLGITESCQGTVAAFGLINLAIMTGNLGRPGTGSSPIRGQNNVQGACDMGALPNVFSDYQSVTDGAARKRHQAVWGVTPPDQVGLKMPEMLAAAREGALKGLYLVAQDPAQSDPDTQQVLQALEQLEFLVVQDLFLTESARFADVVLPGAGFLEKSGTFVNSDRRIQRIVPAVEPPGEALPDGEITHRLAGRMGYDFGFTAENGSGIDPEKVMVEIASLTPNWGGVTYQRLDALGFLQWPCPDVDHPGTDIVHRAGRFIRGRARLTPTPWRALTQSVDSHYPLMLTTGRILFHYNSGSMTRRTPIAALDGAGEERVRIHPVDAARLNIVTGERVAVISRQGRVTLLAQVSDQSNPGLLFMAFHFPQTRTNLLIGNAADEQTLCPEYKVTPVRLEKVS
ncbi:MAG: formate dehydrogenase subunit alpha [Magnetococcales bacterium]|nr:formate dehydrogenase subunit alpha [Magnetococcales bacterium]